MEMSEQARQAKREYERKWRAENKERVQAMKKRYWERRAKEVLENNAKAVTSE